MKENAEIIRLLLNMPQIEINVPYKSRSINQYYEYNTYESTALHFAAKKENNEIIKLLISKSDAIVNIPQKHLLCYHDGKVENQLGEIALHIAVEEENIEIIQYLLSLDNIDVNAIFETSINLPDDYYKKTKTPLVIAINKRNIEIVKLFLTKPELNINQIIEYDISWSWRHEKTVLQLAVENDFNEIAQLLIANPKVDINTITKITSTPDSPIYKHNESKYTPLYIAVEKGNIEIVKALLARSDIKLNIIFDSSYEEYFDEDKKITFSGDSETTVLHTAVEKENLEIIQLLLNKPDLDVAISVKEKGTAMKVAIKKENIKIIELLLEKIPKIIDSNDKKEIMKLLEKNGGNDKIMHLIS